MEISEHVEFFPRKKGEVSAHGVTYHHKGGHQTAVEFNLGGENEDRQISVIFLPEHLPVLEEAVRILRKSKGKKPRMDLPGKTRTR